MRLSAEKIKCSLVLIFLSFWSFTSYLSADEGVTVIVPCHYRHFYFLEELINSYACQTELPDEMVISLSEAYRIPEDDITSLTNKPWPFKVILVSNNDSQSAGSNRNIACENSSGDIFICQDADDLPHPQRVEILKYLFRHSKFDHIIHRWIRVDQLDLGDKWHDYDCHHLHTYKINSIKDLKRFDCLTYGCIAIRKSVWEKIHWSTLLKVGEDIKFNRQCIRIFKNTAVLDACMLIYRYEYSSFRSE